MSEVGPSESSQTLSQVDGDDADDGGSVDKFGIPLSVKHASQNMFTLVWNSIHKLTESIEDPLEHGHPFTHICLVCAEKCASSDTTTTTWKTCLMRQQNASNARKHMLRIHPDHPFSVEVSQGRKRDVQGRIEVHNASVSTASEDATRAKKQRTLHKTMSISPDEMKILSTRWLLSTGLPYTVLESKELHQLLQRLSNQPSLVMPARETFYAFAEGDFNCFVDRISRTLQNEFDAALQQPFLAVLHDMWTNAANVNIVGATVTFIDASWHLRSISLLAKPNPSSHAARNVAALIKSGIQSRYGIDIECFSRFIVSDTTGSARNVSDHFSQTDQVDCLMHLLSLCLLYALGLKENTRNNGQDVVTPGGEFRAGLRVIQKLRDLATFFNSPQRLATLKQLKDFYNLPAVNIEVDSKTRVGYAVTLMRRCVYNHYAFTKYFERAPPQEQSVWLNIDSNDWNLITEMEAITDQLAQFSLGEVQKASVSSSYALLFRKILSVSLDLESLGCLVLERPDPMGTEFTQRRVEKSTCDFSLGGSRCRQRLREQLAVRFPDEDINDIKALLLDPRIKSKAATIVTNAAALVQAERELQSEHYTVFKMLKARDEITEEYKGSEIETLPDSGSESGSANSAIRSLLDIDVPSPRYQVQVARDDLQIQALSEWNHWKSLSVKWPCTAKGGKYNVLHLYREVDVLA